MTQAPLSPQASDTTLPTTAEDTAKVTRAYGLMIMGIILIVVPLPIISGLALLLLLVGIFYTYIIKRSLADKPVSLNHRQWLIRTFWISSLLFMLCMVIAWAFTTTYADSTAIENMMLALDDGTMTPELAAELTTDYQRENKTILQVADIIVAAPTVLYVLARLVRGYRLLDGYKLVPNVKTWLV